VSPHAGHRRGRFPPAPPFTCAFVRRLPALRLLPPDSDTFLTSYHSQRYLSPSVLGFWKCCVAVRRSAWPRVRHCETRLTRSSPTRALPVWAASHLGNCRTPSRFRSLVRLAAVLGILASAISLASPIDDDVQQEFALARRHHWLSAKTSRSASPPTAVPQTVARAQVQAQGSASPLQPRWMPSTSPHASTTGRIIARKTGDRSPPVP
jgi:hypothetical protein